MKLSHRLEDHVYVLSIEDNLALGAAQELENYLKPTLEDSSIKGIIINLEKITYIDSAGLGVIAMVFKTLKARGGIFALCRLNLKLQEIFTLTGLDRMFSVYPTEEEALNAVKAGDQGESDFGDVHFKGSPTNDE